jgi:hypothetical protein
MKLIEDIKNFLGKWQLHKEIKHKKAKNNLVAFGQVNHVGIVYNAETKEHEQLVARYANELRAEGKKVFMLGYVDAKQLPANKKFLLNSEFFWREKLNGINLPIKGNIGQFLQLEFDLLLNLYQEPLLPMQAISAFSKAKYRVGANVADNIDFNDATIDTGNRNDVKFLIEQIDFYLRSIK